VQIGESGVWVPEDRVFSWEPVVFFSLYKIEM
jgi:hypothetical protein